MSRKIFRPKEKKYNFFFLILENEMNQIYKWNTKNNI